MIVEEISKGATALWLLAAANDESSGASEQGVHRPAGTTRLRVLIVEDEFFISLDNQNLLQALGHEVVGIAVSAEEAIRLAGSELPDVVLMDIRLIGPRDGIDAAEEIRARFGIGCIFVTANTDAGTQARAQATRPLGFLAKPLTEHRLRLGLANVASRK